MSVRFLFFKIQAMSEQASIESGTSYDEYIRLFSLYFERSFKRRSKEALKIARQFGYDAAVGTRVGGIEDGMGSNKGRQEIRR